MSLQGPRPSQFTGSHVLAAARQPPLLVGCPGESHVVGLGFFVLGIVFVPLQYADTTGPGNLSWLPPRTRPSWTAPLDASEYGPGCWQTHHNPDVPTNQSYDCLNVNIYAPITAAPVGVMVFFHGGTFVEGSNQGPFGMYNGAYIASTHK